MAGEEILTQDELHALMEGIAESKVVDGPEGTDQFRPYDLVSPEGVITRILPLLETIHERFAHQLQANLFELLRREAEVTIGAIEVCGYRDFIASLRTPCSINIINISPLNGPGLLVIEQQLVFLVVDTFFGGAGGSYNPPGPREFTATDNRLIQRLVNSIFRALGAAWKSFLEIRCTQLGSETNPQFVVDINPTEILVLIKLQVKLDKTAGDLYLALPGSMFEPVRSALLASVNKEHPSRDERLTLLLREGLKDSRVSVRGQLTDAELSLRELLALKVGDFIPMDIPAEAILEAEGVPVFTGRYGVTKGWRAIEIQKMLNSLQAGWANHTEGPNP